MSYSKPVSAALCLLLAAGLIACDASTVSASATPTNAAPDSAKADKGTIGPARCSFETPWLAASSSALKAAARDTQTFTALPPKLDPLFEAQLVAAGVQLEISAATDSAATDSAATDSAAAVLAGFDDHTVWLATVRLADEDYTWLQGYLGDTEVGVVFAVGHATVQAEISDGDILGCVAAPSAPGPAPAAPTCSPNTAWLVDSTAALQAASETVEGFISAALPTGIAADQLLAAARHLNVIAADGSLIEAIGQTDDRAWIRARVVLHGAAFDWFKTSLGDTPVGVVFDADTTTLTAEISDGEVWACAPAATEPAPEPAASVCSFDITGLADSAADLKAAAESTETFNLATLPTGVAADQLLAAARHLNVIAAGGSLTEAIDHTDDHAWIRSRVVLHGAAFDWLKTYLGDTQVGAVFEADTTTLRAEISDGDILGCAVD